MTPQLHCQNCKVEEKIESQLNVLLSDFSLKSCNKLLAEIMLIVCDHCDSFLIDKCRCPLKYSPECVIAIGFNQCPHDTRTSRPAPSSDDVDCTTCKWGDQCRPLAYIPPCYNHGPDSPARAAAQAREGVLKELKADLQRRFISSSNQWSKGRNSGLLECCNIIDESLRTGGDE